MKVVVFNLGCKVNQYESDSMVRQLELSGHNVSENLEYADIYIINTCAVTNEAERKSRQVVGKCNKINPNAKIYVCGCASQNNADSFKDKPNVEYVMGVANKASLVNKINKKGIDIVPLPTEYEDDFLTNRVRTRAYVKIQDGCNNFCAYCLIPYLRGRSRSRKIESVVKECEVLAEYSNEIVLTGIDISSYGSNIGTSLVDLLNALASLKCRIRLGSLEVNIVTRELLDATLKLKAFCPHFHLSLQSGADGTLKAMNRHYTTDEYLQKVLLIREYYPLAGITTDLICGYPTETNEQFEKTLQFIDKIQFSDMHIFAYSKRNGTVASKLGQLDKDLVHTRCKRATEIAKKNKIKFNAKFIGKECEVLVEDNGGYTREYVRINTPNQKIDSIINVIPLSLTEEGLTVEGE